MIGCPVSAAGIARLAVVLATAALVAGPASGQDSVGRPLQLLPPAEDGRRPEVEVDTLAPQDVAGAGLLSPAEGGFGLTAWRGARREEVAALLAGLPVAAASQVMSDLSVRLLLTSARPPDGDPLDPSLPALRAQRLLEMGRTDALAALLEAVSPMRRDEPVARALVESLLLAGRVPDACAELRLLMPLHQGRFWQQALVLCQAVGGERAAARLGLGLLREGDAGDPVFMALVEALVEETPPALPEDGWPRGVAPDPLAMAAFTLAGLAIPETRSMRVPGRLLAVAGNAANETGERLAAAEAAAAAGAMTPAALAALYADAPLPELPVAELLDLVLDMDGPVARAHLVQAAARSARPGAVYRLYDAALGVSRADGAPLAIVLALLEPLPAADEGAAMAADAARAYYAAGELDRAWAWHEVAARTGNGAEDRAALVRLWPLAVLSGALDGRAPGQEVTYARTLSEWIEAEVAISGEAGSYSAAMALAAFSALGEPVDQDVWLQIAVDDARESASLPSAGIWWRLPAAARDGNVGMVVLMSLVAIGDGGPARVSPALLERVLAAMMTSGLDEDARRLAREAIWATQL